MELREGSFFKYSLYFFKLPTYFLRVPGILEFPPGISGIFVLFLSFKSKEYLGGLLLPVDFHDRIGQKIDRAG